MIKEREFIYFRTSHTFGEMMRDIVLVMAVVLSWTAVILILTR
jgi:hypothetical protein